MVRRKQATMIKRLQSANTSPPETDNENDEDSENTSIRAPIEHDRPEQSDNNMAMFGEIMRAQREDNRNILQVVLQGQREMVNLMVNGNNQNRQPQVTIAIAAPKPFYADEKRDTQSFEEWIATVEEYARRTGQPALEVLQGLLEGLALDAFRSVPIQERETFEQAINRIRPMVQPLITPTLAAVKLLDLKQRPNETVAAYQHRYQRLYQKTTVHHIERATWLHGLSPKIREKMMASLSREQDRNALRQVQEATVTKDQLVRSVNRATNGNDSATATDSDDDESQWCQVRNNKHKVSSRRTTRCHTHPKGHHSDEECGQNYYENHKKKGHPTAQCHMTEECTHCGKTGHPSQRCYYKDFTCHNCDQIGHVTARCTERKATCAKCGTNGHLDQWCRRPPEYRSRRINRIVSDKEGKEIYKNKIRATTNLGNSIWQEGPTETTLDSTGSQLYLGNKPCNGKVIIDSGADLNVIPRKVAEQAVQDKENKQFLEGVISPDAGLQVKTAMTDDVRKCDEFNGDMRIDDGNKYRVRCVVADVDHDEILLCPPAAKRMEIALDLRKMNKTETSLHREGRHYGGVCKDWYVHPAFVI